MFYPKNFVVLALQFRSLIHFKFILYMVWAKGLTSFFCMWISSCRSIICWKDHSFSIEFSWHSCWKSVVHKCMGYFWTLSSTSLIYMSTLMAVPHNLGYFSFVIRKCFIQLCSSFSRLLGYSESLAFPYQLRSACEFLQKRQLGFW